MTLSPHIDIHPYGHRWSWIVGPHFWKSGEAKTYEKALEAANAVLPEYEAELERLEAMSMGEWRMRVLQEIGWSRRVSGGGGGY